MNPPSRERNIPSATSPLAGPPRLTPKVGPLKVGGQGQDEEEDRVPQESDRDQEPPARRPSRPGRSRGGRRPPPEAASAVPTTVRFDVEEAGQIDRFILELRSDAHRTQLDKAEVFRELIRMAQEHEPTRKALLRRLR